MPTRESLSEAIRETYGKPDSYEKATKLATFLTLKSLLYPDAQESLASYDPKLLTDGDSKVGAYGQTEFLTAVAGMEPARAWSVMGELMETLQVLNPRLYAGVMRQLRQ